MISAHFGLSKAKPKRLVFWKAHSETKDFRKSEWSVFHSADPAPSGPRDSGVGTTVKLPKSGYEAAFADYTFEIDGLEYHLSSQITIFGPKGKLP